mgnify:CR=1 FL=1
MPLNLLKKYNALLELVAMNPKDRDKSLRGVFNRDIVNNISFIFRSKQVNPTSKDGETPMETLFSHLTTKMTDTRTRKREFEIKRSIRLHWVKHHIDEKKVDNMLVFSVNEPEGVRTYIYDKDEKYVIVLEPLRIKSEYYLLSAFYVEGKDAKRDTFIKKYDRQLPELLSTQKPQSILACVFRFLSSEWKDELNAHIRINSLIMQINHTIIPNINSVTRY